MNSDLVKLLSRTRQQGSCWIWTGPTGEAGYGAMRVAGRFRGTHVASFLLHGGELQPGQRVLHSCDVRRCVNPLHLWAGTQSDNMVDRSMKGRCPHRKLTELDAVEIRSSPLSLSKLAEKFGVHVRAVWQVRKGLSFRYVP